MDDSGSCSNYSPRRGKRPDRAIYHPPTGEAREKPREDSVRKTSGNDQRSIGNDAVQSATSGNTVSKRKKPEMQRFDAKFRPDDAAQQPPQSTRVAQSGATTTNERQQNSRNLQQNGREVGEKKRRQNDGKPDENRRDRQRHNDPNATMSSKKQQQQDGEAKNKDRSNEEGRGGHRSNRRSQNTQRRPLHTGDKTDVGVKKSEDTRPGDAKDQVYVKSGNNAEAEKNWRRYAPQYSNNDSQSQTTGKEGERRKGTANAKHPPDRIKHAKTSKSPLPESGPFLWSEEMERHDREISYDRRVASIANSDNNPTKYAAAEAGPSASQRGGIIQLPPSVASNMGKRDRARGSGRESKNGRGSNNPRRGRGPYSATAAQMHTSKDFHGYDDGRPMKPTSSDQYYPAGNYPSVSPEYYSTTNGSLTYGPPGTENDIMLNRTMYNLEQLEVKLKYLLSVLMPSEFDVGSVDEMMTCREILQNAFVDALLFNLSEGEQHNLEHRLWKNAFYQPIEALRFIVSQPNIDVSYGRTVLLDLIQHATEFYQTLIAEQERKSMFALSDYYSSIDEKLSRVLPPMPSPRGLNIKRSIVSCQRYLLSLGDLARYREQVKNTSQYGLARSYYMKAAQLVPSNGRVHNQLALLAVYTHRHLDAVFYYMRSLAASHPFETAGESLMGLFEEIRKKVDHYEYQLRTELDRLKKEKGILNHRKPPTLHNRREIWILADGTSLAMKPDAAAEAPVDEVSLLTKVFAQELHRRCIGYLLHAAGILFTKIGVESFEVITELALIQLKALLHKDESPLTSLQLVQLCVVAFFLIHYTSGKETERGTVSMLQNNAVMFGFSIFGLMLERLGKLLGDKMSETLEPNVLLLLPAIRAFSVWMTECTYKLYSGFSSNGGLETERFSVSLWANFAKICTIIDSYKTSGKLLVVERENGKKVECVLPEDMFMTSFCGVFYSKPRLVSVCDGVDLQVAVNHFRLHSLLDLAYFLDGQGFDAFYIKDGEFVTAERSSSPGPGTARIVCSDDEDDVYTRNKTGSGMDDAVEETSHEMSQLQLLQKERELKQSLLEREGQYHMEVIVKPSRLVVDTNGFVEHLQVIDKIVHSKKYHLVVPFVVYNELLGLRKSDDEWLADQATLAVEMLDRITKTENIRHVMAVTTTGEVFNTFEYHNNEEFDRKVSNDDLILKCCQSLCNADVSRGSEKEIKNLKYEPITIHRTIVLLTDDKNLRLKATATDIPVRGIRQFARWSKISV